MFHVEAIKITTEGVDPYAARGIAISRDTASIVIACMARDQYELETRGGDANLRHAAEISEIRKAIGHILVTT